MKNKEKYFNELMEIIINGSLLAVDKFTNEPKDCYNKLLCVDCLFREGCNDEGRKEWLEEEYQEPITLTEDEKAILRNLDKGWKWIARDKNGELYVYTDKPYKDEWIWKTGGEGSNLGIFKHLFKLIKWKDEEPYNIDELLKQNGVER